MFRFTTAQSLLSLPADAIQPHPYEVLGLRTGEPDPQVIAAAIRAKIQQLNEAKASSDPVAWKQAASWVNSARANLNNAVLKQQLDLKLGVITRPTTATPATQPPTAASPAPTRPQPSPPAAATKPAAAATKPPARPPASTGGPAKTSGPTHANPNANTNGTTGAKRVAQPKADQSPQTPRTDGAGADQEPPPEIKRPFLEFRPGHTVMPIFRGSWQAAGLGPEPPPPPPPLVFPITPEEYAQAVAAYAANPSAGSPTSQNPATRNPTAPRVPATQTPRVPVTQTPRAPVTQTPAPQSRASQPPSPQNPWTTPNDTQAPQPLPQPQHVPQPQHAPHPQEIPFTQPNPYPQATNRDFVSPQQPAANPYPAAAPYPGQPYPGQPSPGQMPYPGPQYPQAAPAPYGTGAAYPGQPADPPLIQTVSVATPSRSSRKKKRGIPWLNVAMAAFAVSCLAAVLGLVYALTRNGQGIVISMGPDNPNGANQGQSNPAQDRVMPSAEPRPRPRAASQSLARDIEARQRDPQLKEKMAESEKWLQSIGDKADAAAKEAAAQMPAPAMPAPAMPAPAMPAPAMPTPDQPAPNTPTPEPPKPETPPATPAPPTTPEPPATPPTPPPPPPPAEDPAKVAAADMALAAARKAIASADWANMIKASSDAASAAISDPQKESAARLAKLAELAEYYHGAIDMAVNKLGAGQTFELTEQLTVAVVEVTPEKLIVRFNGRNKEYPRRDIPLVIAHKVARMSIPPDAPTTQIAAEAYQAIAPISTPQYRDQAIKKLESFPEEVEGIRPSDLVAAIRELKAD